MDPQAKFSLGIPGECGHRFEWAIQQGEPNTGNAIPYKPCHFGTHDHWVSSRPQAPWRESGHYRRHGLNHAHKAGGDRGSRTLLHSPHDSLPEDPAMRPLLALPLLLLTACSQDYRFSSNLDPDNFDQYFAAGNVALVDALPSNAKVLGLVEGQSCQRTGQDPAPSQADARTDMRAKAAQLGADRVKLLRCSEVDPEASGCLALMICYGQAARSAQ